MYGVECTGRVLQVVVRTRPVFATGYPDDVGKDADGIARDFSHDKRVEDGNKYGITYVRMVYAT